MSDFVQQQNTVCDFNSSDSWVILSPIEQSIKRKIEAVGTPLKAWDINIYRGVLTGYNDAFIISSEKRDEILANCQTDEERQKTAELIRPFKNGTSEKSLIISSSLILNISASREYADGPPSCPYDQPRSHHLRHNARLIFLSHN